MKRLVRLISLLLIFILLTRCNDRKIISSRQIKVMQTCIDSLMTGEFKSINESYLINPYFGLFKFNNYVSKNYDSVDVSYKNKEKVLNKLKMSNNDFLELQNRIGTKVSKKFHTELSDLSKGNESNLVLTFSIVSDNLVFVEVINYRNKINKKDFFKKVDDTREKKDIVSLAILLKGERIIEITVDEMVVKEFW